MNEQVMLQQFGAAAVRNERLAARARHEHPLVPAKPCASRQKCHSVVYTVREDELAAVVASMNSVLHRSKEPDRVCFHLIVPVGMDAGKLCRMTMAHAADNPDRFCPLKNGVLSQTEHFCPQAELLPIKGVTFNTTRGEHWVGECFCGTSQVRINCKYRGRIIGVRMHGGYLNPARSGPSLGCGVGADIALVRFGRSTSCISTPPSTRPSRWWRHRTQHRTAARLWTLR